MSLETVLEPETTAVGQDDRQELSLDEVLPCFDERGHHVSPVVDWSAGVSDPAVQTELRLALTAAINELPAGYRTALVLRDVEGLSHLDIANVLGLSVSTVKARVHRARLFIRKQLTDVMTRLTAAITTRDASCLAPT